MATIVPRQDRIHKKQLVKARDHHWIDCGRNDLLEYDHVPTYAHTGHTITTELKLRCAPCHHQRHRTSIA